MQLSFLHPEWFIGIPVVGIACLALFFLNKRRGAARTGVRWVFYPMGLILCLVALARPQLGRNTSQRRAGGGQVFLAVDISRSMMAQDVAPSRLKFAKSALQFLAPYLEGSHLALYPFAADGYLQVPLTRDTDSILNVLNMLGPSMTTDQGTDLSQALDTLFAQILKMEKEHLNRGEDWPPTQVLLFSDGESHHSLRNEVFAKYRNKKIPVFTIGTATDQGSRIPLSFENALTTFQSGAYLRDNSGKVIETRLDQKKLESIAEATGGQYFPARLAEMKRLGNHLQQKQGATSVTTAVQVEAEYYPLLLTLALLCFFIDFCRQRWEYAIRLSPLAFLPLSLLLAGAAPPDAIKDIQTHLELATDNNTRGVLAHNLGIAYTQKNDLERAAQAHQEAAYLTEDPSVRKKTLFNLGNTLLQLQKLPEAIEAYQAAYDIKSGDKGFDRDTNKKLSENMALAAQILSQAQSSSSGDGESESGQQPQDPKGSKKDYKSESFSPSRKQKIFDLLSNEEQQAMQRLQRNRDGKKPVSPQAKTW